MPKESCISHSACFKIVAAEVTRLTSLPENGVFPVIFEPRYLGCHSGKRFSKHALSGFMGWRLISCAWMFALATGFIQAAESGAANHLLAPPSESPLPVLNTAEQVHLLSRQ